MQYHKKGMGRASADQGNRDKAIGTKEATSPGPDSQLSVDFTVHRIVYELPPSARI
jgi:hypothetical protein